MELITKVPSTCPDNLTDGGKYLKVMVVCSSGNSNKDKLSLVDTYFQMEAIFKEVLKITKRMEKEYT